MLLDLRWLGINRDCLVRDKRPALKGNHKARDRLHLTPTIALALLPRWARHDFWRQSEPAHQRAKETIVNRLVEAVEADFDLSERIDRSSRRLPSLEVNI
jgi:hypothetical protein